MTLFKPAVYIVAIIVSMYIIRLAFGTKVYIFHSETCPACTATMPEWNKFQDRLGITSLIIPVKIDIDRHSNKTLTDDFAIESVPTIVKIKDDVRMYYDGERTADAILDWAKK